MIRTADLGFTPTQQWRPWTLDGCRRMGACPRGAVVVVPSTWRCCCRAVHVALLLSCRPRGAIVVVPSTWRCCCRAVHVALIPLRAARPRGEWLFRWVRVTVRGFAVRLSDDSRLRAYGNSIMCVIKASWRFIPAIYLGDISAMCGRHRCHNSSRRPRTNSSARGCAAMTSNLTCPHARRHRRRVIVIRAERDRSIIYSSYPRRDEAEVR